MHSHVLVEQMPLGNSIGAEGTLECGTRRVMELAVVVELTAVVGDIGTEGAFEFLYL